MSQVLNRERMKEVSGLLQLLGICIGFAVMLVIEIYGRIHRFKSLDVNFTIIFSMSLSVGCVSSRARARGRGWGWRGRWAGGRLQRCRPPLPAAVAGHHHHLPACRPAAHPAVSGLTCSYNGRIKVSGFICFIFIFIHVKYY